MNKSATIHGFEKNEPIDEYLECLAYCSVESFTEGNDCQIICMERHLQANYF